MDSMSLFIKTLTTSYLMSTSSGTMIVFFSSIKNTSSLSSVMWQCVCALCDIAFVHLQVLACQHRKPCL